MRVEGLAAILCSWTDGALGLALDLRLDQRRIDIAGADRVAGEVSSRRLERRHLGETDKAVLGGDVGGFDGDADEPWRRRR